MKKLNLIFVYTYWKHIKYNKLPTQAGWDIQPCPMTLNFCISSNIHSKLPSKNDYLYIYLSECFNIQVIRFLTLLLGLLIAIIYDRQTTIPTRFKKCWISSQRKSRTTFSYHLYSSILHYKLGKNVSIDPVSSLHLQTRFSVLLNLCLKWTFYSSVAIILLNVKMSPW